MTLEMTLVVAEHLILLLQKSKWLHIFTMLVSIRYKIDMINLDRVNLN